MQLRPYQEACVRAVFDCLGSHRSALVDMATGLGKTVIFSHVAARWPSRVLIMAHREELVRQAGEKVQAVTGEEPGIEMADSSVPEHSAYRRPKVVIASVQTLTSGDRLGKFNPDNFGLVIPDEAHHSVANSYRRVFAHFDRNPDSRRLGFTATPERADDLALGQVFEAVAFRFGIEAAVDEGWLVPVSQHAVYVDGLDFSKVKTIKRDFSEGELEQILTEEAILHKVAAPVVRLAGDRPTLVFCCSVKHAELMSLMIDRYKPRSAAFLCGESTKEERSRRITAFRAGHLQFLCNCNLVTEGFDAPNTAVVVMARPTKSPALYCLDTETEILTKDGWKGCDQVTTADQVAAWQGDMHWSPVLAKVVRDVAPGEQMVCLDSPALSLRVTDNHRIVFRQRRGRAHAWQPWRMEPACSVAQLKDSWQLPVSGTMPSRAVPLSDDEIRFIGWFLTDGTLNRCNNAITISQADHQPFNASVRSCLEGCGFKYGFHTVDRRTEFPAESSGGSRTYVYEHSRLNIYTVSKGPPRGRDRHLRGWGDLEPYIDKDFSPLLEDLTAEQLAVLLDAAHQANGQKQPKNVPWVQRSYHIGTGNRQFADRLQSLCVRRGFRCNLHVDRRSERGPRKDYYFLHIKPKSVQWVGGAASADRPHLRTEPSAPGERVWCVQTDNGTLVTRRHGKVCVLGNCQILGRGTRPLPDTVDGLATAEERRAAIAASAKPGMLVLDFVGNSGRHQIITATDILGGKYGAPVRAYAKETLSAEQRETPVAEALDRAARELALDADQQEYERRREIKAEAAFRTRNVSPFGGGRSGAVAEQKAPRGEPATEKQVRYLCFLGVPYATAKSYTKRQAGAVIDSLLRKREEGQGS